MTDAMQVTPEDRERLAKSKFGEWFDEFFEKKFDEAIKKHGTTATRTPAQQAVQQGGQQQQHEETPQPRRSLLETCLSQTFGF